MPRTQCLEAAEHVFPLPLRLDEPDTATTRDAQGPQWAGNLLCPGEELLA